MKRWQIIETILGSTRSGNWGHAGRPGKRGGSVPRSVAMSIRTGKDWKERQARAGKFGPAKLDAVTKLWSVPFYDATHDSQDPDYEWERMLEGGDYDEALTEYFGRGDRKSSNFEYYNDLAHSEEKLFGLIQTLDSAPFPTTGVVAGWADPTSPTSMSLQQAVVDEFGLRPTGYFKDIKTKRITDGVIDKACLPTGKKYEGSESYMKGSLYSGLPHFDKSGRESFARKMYEHTQRDLKESLPTGTEYVRLYRGTRNPAVKNTKKGDRIELETAPLTPWTVSPAVAASYVAGMGGKTIYADFPVSRVFSTGVSGMGLLGQGEMIMFGGKDVVEVYNDSWD